MRRWRVEKQVAFLLQGGAIERHQIDERCRGPEDVEPLSPSGIIRSDELSAWVDWDAERLVRRRLFGQWSSCHRRSLGWRRGLHSRLRSGSGRLNAWSWKGLRRWRRLL